MADFPTLQLELPYSLTRLMRVTEAETDGGRYAYSWDSTPARRWELTFGYLDSTDRAVLVAFWVARGGAYETFDFTDPDTLQEYTVRFVGDTLDTRWVTQLRAEIRVTIQQVR
jgi:hypothetical protein